MKQLLPITLGTLLALSSACKQGPKDTDVQANVNNKIAANTSASSVTATVKDGVVTLSGTCPTQDCITSTETQVKDVEGVKQVVNNIRLEMPVATAPVEVTADEPLKAAVQNAISGYKEVKADVTDGVVTLTGEIKRSELTDLMQKITVLKPRKVENKLTIK